MKLSAFLLSAMAMGSPSPGHAQIESSHRDALRVCADPDAMPFSATDGQGFENRLATKIAADLGVPLEYVWFPQTIGFVRNTLGAHVCDLILGTASDEAMIQTTSAYYRSSYALVLPADSSIDLGGVNAGRLRHRRVGIIERTPGQALATALGITDVTSYQLLSGSTTDQPARSAIEDVAHGVTDAAFIWAPIAGYYAHQLNLRVVQLPNGTAGQHTEFNVAMGLRPGEPEWKRWLNRWITSHRTDIAAILADYHVPVSKDGGM